MSGASTGGRRLALGPAGSRFAVGAVAAAVALAVAIAAGASWSVDVLVAWDAAAVAYLALVWPAIAPKDAAATSEHAQREEGPRPVSEAVLLGAAAASLVAVAFTLREASALHHGARVTLSLFAVASVGLAWACVHTVYTLRYARLYFTAPQGGLSFGGDDPPEYADFAYVALTIGMCYQVSDTDISKRPLRRAAIHHALLSYLFGAVILAVAVSTLASLIGS